MRTLVLILWIVLASMIQPITGQRNLTLRASPFAVLGSSYHLSCITEIVYPVIIWYKYAEYKYHKVGNIVTSDCTISGHLSLYNMTCGTQATDRGEYMLTILNVSLTDEGAVWFCYANGKRQWSNRIKIELAEPPSKPRVKGASNVGGYLQLNTTESHTLSLICESDGGKPIPHIMWVTNETTLVTTRGSKVEYTFTPMWKSHRQEYICLASNIALDEELKTTILLNVAFRPKFMTMFSILSATKCQEEFQITCPDVESNPSTPLIYRWTKSGVQVGTRKILTIGKVNRSHAGLYTCRVSNSVGTSDPSSVFLNVLFSPEPLSSLRNITVTEGQEVVKIVCPRAEANPSTGLKYKWTKSGRQVGTGQLFNINNASRGDAGQYLCYISNSVGTSEPVSMTLDVMYSSKVVNLQLNVSNSVQEGSDVAMICEVDGNPMSNIVWFRLSTDVPLKRDTNVNKSELILPALNCRDTGYYTCSSTNSIGNPSNRTLEIHVLCAPRIVNPKGKTSVKSVKLGAKLRLSLRLVSNPEPLIKWYHTSSSNTKPQPRELLSSGALFYSIFEKENTTKADLGLYTVTVSNSHGAIEHIFQVVEQPGEETGASGECLLNPVGIGFTIVGTLLSAAGIGSFVVTMLKIKELRKLRNGGGGRNNGHEIPYYDVINASEIHTTRNVYDGMEGQEALPCSSKGAQTPQPNTEGHIYNNESENEIDLAL